MLESNNDSDENKDYDEDNEQSEEAAIDNRLFFVRQVPDEAPAPNKYLSEWRKRRNDTEATKIEFERVSPNWIEYQVKWKKLLAKK